MRRSHKKKKKINIIAIEDTVRNIECFNDLEFLPDYFYDDREHDVAEHFINQWSEEEDEDISEVCIGRRINSNTPQDI